MGLDSLGNDPLFIWPHGTLTVFTIQIGELGILFWGLFWFILDPDQPDEECWVWGKYATT